jgi:O-antigen/teichoic acid export membrane protein
LLRLNRLGATLAVAFGAALFVLFALAGRPLIRLAVGAQFEGAYLPLLVLAAAHVATLWAGTTNVLLNMIGRERDVLVCAGVSATLNVLLCALAIPRWGMLGAAVGSALALVAWRILLSRFLRRRLDVAPA